MATWYVDSAAAGTAAGTSWVNACTTIAAAITLSSAGDDFNVKNTHAETAASAKTLSFKGTAASPNRVFSCTAANSPATAADLTAGASVTTTSNNGISITGYAYIFGITFSYGSSGFSGTAMGLAQGTASRLVLDTCTLASGNTGSSSILAYGSSGAACFIKLVNCVVTFANTGGQIQASGGSLQMIGGSIAATGSVPTNLIRPQAQGTDVTLDGVNLSAMGSGSTLITPNNQLNGCRFINCRLGASATVSATPTGPDSQVDLIVSDSSTSDSRQERYHYAGTLTTEATIIRTSGASNGTTGISWKVATTANAKLQQPFPCFETAIWNATTGASKTVTVELVNDGTTLTNAEAWIEAEYLGTSSYPLATMISSAPATLLTTASNLSTSSVTWTTTGLASPIKQYMAVTFTPQMVGLIRVRIFLARASKTIYVDPKLTVT